MDTTDIDLAIESAFNVALNNPKRVPSHTIMENVVIHTDLYSTSKGNGFIVTATINLTPLIDRYPTKISRTKQSGPEVNLEKPWPINAS
jgi:hypothetical protein